MSDSEYDDESLVELFLGNTGARPGDVIIGQQKCTMKAMLRLHNTHIFPQKKFLDELRDNDDKWNLFLSKLSSISFFANMSIEEREEWLSLNETTSEFIGDDTDSKINKNKNTLIEILDVGTSTLTSQVETEDLELLMEGKEDSFYSVEEIESKFPRKAGSSARKHTLFFMKQFWVVVNDFKIATSFDGVIFDVENGLIKSHVETKDDEELIVIDGINKNEDEKQNISFLVSKERFDLSKINELIKDVYKGLVIEDSEYIILDDIDSVILKIRNDLRGYTAGSFKSLMQKIIRFGADKISLLDGELVDSGIVILVVVGMLAQNPGSFVPDIQRYVTGIESVAKRLGIICGFEDSYTPPERVSELVSLFSGALLSQRVRSWKPSRNTLKSWMTTAYKSLREKRAIDYEKESENLSITDWWTLCHEKGLEMDPYYICEEQSPIKMCSAILDTLRSFDGDIGMVRHISSVYPNCELIQQDRPQELVMPLCHGTDQHWASSFVYFFSPKTIMKNKGSTRPFDKIFTRVFQEVTGFNPRRDEISEEFEDDEFVKETRRSQTLFLSAKQNIQIKRKHTKLEHYKSSFTLSDSWLAGMVGAIEISGNPQTIVTLRPENIYQLIAIRKPSRNMAENITPEREELSKKIAKEMLQSGIKLKGTHPPSDIFKNSIVKLVDDEYIIESNGISISWDDAKEINISLPYHNASIKNMETAISQWGEGIEINAFEKLDKLLDKTNTNVIYRVLSYIANYKFIIEMNKVSRDGSGTYQSVGLTDVQAFQFMLTLSQIFPAALRPVEKFPQRFSVQIGPLLWNIVSKIKDHLKNPEQKQDENGWDNVDIKDSLERVAWPHQTETTDEMVRNFKSGSKGIFLCLPVGMGKTMIVMNYLLSLKNMGKLTRYIIYTLPPSAIESVVHEIQAFGIPILYIIPLKSIKNKNIPKGVCVSQKCVLKEFAINIVAHDHLRKCSDELLIYASECTFLVDEVHKGLNESKRTSTLLDIARLSRLFVIFTGTPIIDNKIYKLIWWFEQISDFEVNIKNFWVSANSMVARKISTGVIVNTKEIVAKFKDDEKSEYKKLVPVAMGGENKYTSNTDFNDAYKLCIIIVSRRMIEETMVFVNNDKRVMLVAQNKNHQDLLKDMLVTRGIKDQDIFVLTGNKSIFFTDESVKKKTIHDFRVVIVPINKPEGYTLTRCIVMITSVYPSNEATREQIQGRINRISQSSNEIDIITVHCGILTYILKNHNQAKSLSIAFSDIAKKLDNSQLKE